MTILSNQRSWFAPQNKFINVVGFQIVWWSSVLLGYVSLPLTLILISLHLGFHRQTNTEFCVLFICASLGYFIDLTLSLAGVFYFDQHFAGPKIPPLWLFTIWLGFAATLRTSLGFFRQHLILGSILAAISGPGSYLAAANLGAVSLPLGIINTGLVLAVIWAALFPMLVLISKKLEPDYAATNHA